jgi:hypothetical protein
MFAETAIVDYRLSFADHGKQISFSANKLKFAASVLRFQQTNRSHHFLLVPFSVCIA